MQYSQSEAETSKDAILQQLRASTHTLEDIVADSIGNSAMAIAVIVVILMLTLIIISLAIFVYLGVITGEKSLIALFLSSVYIVAVSTMLVRYVTEYVLKSARATGDVFNNYVSSEDAVETINGTATTYKTVSTLTAVRAE